MRVIFLGDIVGAPGREAVFTLLPGLRAEYSPDLVIANAENAAGGWGITHSVAHDLLTQGVDVLTLGNHTWAKNNTEAVLCDEPRVLRPANYPPGTPGRGWGLYRTGRGALVGVVNLNGRVFMEPLDDPFRVADEIIQHLRAQTNILIFDFHAETTSEKSAFGWHCDGRVSAVIGTHTHVQTADERLLPGGTAYITDAGMCGPIDSVIGMDVSVVLSRFRTQMPHRFKVAEGSGQICGVMVEIAEDSGRAQHIERVCRKV